MSREKGSEEKRPKPAEGDLASPSRFLATSRLQGSDAASAARRSPSGASRDYADREPHITVASAIINLSPGGGSRAVNVR